MHRRKFLRSLLEAGAFSVGARFATGRLASAPRPQLALTIDDPALELGPYMHWPEANQRILELLRQRQLNAALFVCGKRVQGASGHQLLRDWNDADHLICNHSYSHPNFNLPETTYSRFVSDFQNNEQLLSAFQNRTKLFRYPFLKEGDTAEKRDGFRAFLKQSDYRVGYVTIDTSDWYVNERMQDALQRDSRISRVPYRDYLISHLLDRTVFYRQLSIDVLGHDIPQTILLHYHMLNALFLPDVMNAFEQKGWEWIDARKAFDNPVFLRQPKTLPAGESLIWAIAAEDGRFKDRLRYPGEDDIYEKPKMDRLGL